VKELEDHRWFPSLLRNFQTEYIGFVATRLKVYDAFVNYLRTSPPERVPMEDLCSGSGEPAITIFRESKCFTGLSLSDKFPNRSFKSPDERIIYNMQPVDVRTMEFKPGKSYTMFNAFHHFSDEEKLNIVQRMIASGSSAFIVEPLQPGIISLSKVLAAGTLGNLAFTPFIRPFSFARLFFTYIFPVNVLTITLDGIVSVLKSRTAARYAQLFRTCGNTVSIFRISHRFTPLVVIKIGRENSSS
jgi:hypothetical protein